MNRDGIIYSSFRAFFRGLLGVVGFTVGLFILIVFLIALVTSSPSTGSTEQTTTTKILTDAKGKRTTSTTAPVLLQINIDGIIGTEELNAKRIRTILTESREGDFKDDRVKGVLLYINTPGGTVTDADDIYRALNEYKEQYKVPVIAYVDGLCASGGMFIACAADQIYSADVSLIGSVGVIFPSFLNFSDLMTKIGVQSLTVSTGKGKDDMNPLRPWKQGEDDSFRQISNYYYDYFVNLVTKHRPKLTREKLVNDYGANVFPAAIAQDYGYIDVAGVSRSDVLTALAHKAGIGDKEYQVVELESKTFLSLLLRAESPLLTGKIKHELQLNRAMDPALQGKFLYYYLPQP